MKKVIGFFVCCVAFSQYISAGIMRHDKPERAYVQLANEPQFDCVGMLYFGHTWDGSCVLVGTRYVLTAAHCLVTSLTHPDTIKYNGQTIVVNQSYGEYVKDPNSIVCMFKGKKYRGKIVHIYPAYIDCATKHEGDMALIELETEVTGIKPAALCRTYDELHSEIVGVGYGVHGIADKPGDLDTTSKKIAGQNIIDSLCGYKTNGQYVSMLCDFDHPNMPEGNRMGSSTALPLEYITTGGDSGGGAFRKTSNGWELVGICGGRAHGGVDVERLTTKGIGYYEQIMEWQRVSVFANWIDGLMH